MRKTRNAGMETSLIVPRMVMATVETDLYDAGSRL